MVYLEFPSEEGWVRIYQQAPHQGYHVHLNEFLETR
jgi:hypothetical protein